MRVVEREIAVFMAETRIQHNYLKVVKSKSAGIVGFNSFHLPKTYYHFWIVYKRGVLTQFHSYH